MPHAKYRIAGLSIEGFRGFTRPQDFAPESRNLFVFGRNGQGKSSIVEAIRWCLFGTRPGERDIEFRNTFYGEGVCRVAVKLVGTDGLLTINRELRPGQSESRRVIEDSQGREIRGDQALPMLRWVGGQEGALVIFAAQNASGRQMVGDISGFGRVLCHYLGLDKVPDLLDGLRKLREEKTVESEALAREMDEVAGEFRQQLIQATTRLSQLLADPPWRDSAPPTAIATEHAINRYVRDLAARSDHTAPDGMAGAQLLQTAENWLSSQDATGIAGFDQSITQVNGQISRLEGLQATWQKANAAIEAKESGIKHCDAQITLALAGATRHELAAEIARLEAALTKHSACFAVAQETAKLAEEYALTACPACGAQFGDRSLAEYVRSQGQAGSADGGSSGGAEGMRARLNEADRATTAKTNLEGELQSLKNERDGLLNEFTQLLSPESDGPATPEAVENRLAQLRVNLSELKQSRTDSQEMTKNVLDHLRRFRQELDYHKYRDETVALEAILTTGMARAEETLRSYHDLLHQVGVVIGIVEGVFKSALDRTIPPLNEMFTEVYLRLTQQKSYDLVRIYHDPERVGHLELKVGSTRLPGETFPINVLNGQASKALHLVPYFVFSRFQAEVLDLELLLIDDPSESFDTSHVELLVRELQAASEHAQIVVASHEEEKFAPHLNQSFSAHSFHVLAVTGFDPISGPSVERR